MFLVFLKLGLTAFGGPIAHLGYFRQELVIRRRWIGELAKAAIHGLKLVAIVVVAQAVWGMAQALTPNWRRRGIALAAGLVLALVGGAAGQIAAILIGAAGGLVLCRALPTSSTTGLAMAVSRRVGLISLTLFAVLLIGLPMLMEGMGSEISAIFYRAGALVFGGGHVVLPLLRADLVPTGLMTDDQFLGGYGAAQALPGPLFAIAAAPDRFGGDAGGGFMGARRHGIADDVHVTGMRR